jgi:hypothetical protein
MLIPSRVLTRALVALLPFGLAACGAKDDGDKSEKPSKATEAVAPEYPYEFVDGSAEVNREQFGEDWPVTVRAGIVNCIKEGNGSVVAIFQPARSTADNPEKYALNGSAKGSETMAFYGLKDIAPIWADDPATGAKKDIGVLIDVCKPYMP